MGERKTFQSQRERATDKVDFGAVMTQVLFDALNLMIDFGPKETGRQKLSNLVWFTEGLLRQKFKEKGDAYFTKKKKLTEKLKELRTKIKKNPKLKNETKIEKIEELSFIRDKKLWRFLMEGMGRHHLLYYFIKEWEEEDDTRDEVVEKDEEEEVEKDFEDESRELIESDKPE